jgi:hypothetical protein
MAAAFVFAKMFRKPGPFVWAILHGIARDAIKSEVKVVAKTYIGFLYIMSTSSLFCQDNKIPSSNFQRALIKNYLELLLWSNLPPMKAVLFLLLALGASSTSACDHYSYWHCVGSNGVANDSATQSVCDSYGTLASTSTNPCGSDSGTKECSYTGGSLSNCAWRVKCWDTGASGKDSNCRCKGSHWNCPCWAELNCILT